MAVVEVMSVQPTSAKRTALQDSGSAAWAPKEPRASTAKAATLAVKLIRIVHPPIGKTGPDPSMTAFLAVALVFSKSRTDRRRKPGAKLSLNAYSMPKQGNCHLSLVARAVCGPGGL